MLIFHLVCALDTLHLCQLKSLSVILLYFLEQFYYLKTVSQVNLPQLYAALYNFCFLEYE